MIYICDDDPVYTLVLTEVLNAHLKEADLSDSVFSFKSCTEMVNAIHTLDKQKIKPDVIFMDMRMPDVNGAECIKMLSEIYHQPVAIVAMSADLTSKELDGLHNYTKARISKMSTPDGLHADIKAIIQLHLGRNKAEYAL